MAPLLVNGAPLGLRAAELQHPFSILAIGSSSTEGIAASSPSRAYPAQLALELSRRYGVKAEVHNAGIGGETADQTLVRLKAALEKNPPNLVIWQVGTNDALTGMDEARFRAILDAGIGAAEARFVPLILVDPQIPPSRTHDAVFARYADMVEVEAARLHAPVISRYQMMKTLAASNPEGFRSLLSGDGVHMNDLGYACLAHSLAGPIADGLAKAQPHALTAGVDRLGATVAPAAAASGAAPVSQ